MIRTSTTDETEVRALFARLTEVERERSEAREEAFRLTLLHEAFTELATARTPQDVIATMLRAACRPLGFTRGVFFRVDRERGIEAQWQIDSSDVVEAGREEPDLRTGSALLAVLRDVAADGVGRAGELSAPLVDVRGWYVLTPLVGADGTYGILYVDGNRVPEPREWIVSLVRSLVTIASVCIENGLLLAQTRELADRDPLTGLYNRRAFSERLLEEIDLARRHDRALTYVMIDVDDFKSINDTHGHAHGDRTLRSIAKTLTGCSRIEDVVGRYAGDEFMVLLSSVDRALATTLVSRLSQALTENNLRCSLGAALFPENGSDAASLMAAADEALYETKRDGKNGYRFATRGVSLP